MEILNLDTYVMSSYKCYLTSEKRYKYKGKDNKIIQGTLCM